MPVDQSSAQDVFGSYCDGPEEEIAFSFFLHRELALQSRCCFDITWLPQVKGEPVLGTLSEDQVAMFFLVFSIKVKRRAMESAGNKEEVSKYLRWGMAVQEQFAKVVRNHFGLSSTQEFGIRKDGVVVLVAEVEDTFHLPEQQVLS